MLSPLADIFDSDAHPDLLVGMGIADDAAVYRVNARTAVVATLDFFAPVVDDPYTFGAIAAANAMSDVFAMGGEVVLALNIAAFPESLPARVQSAILRGGAEKVKEAGGIVAGGHTVWDVEPKFGLSVFGRVHPARIMRKAGLKPGQLLCLTKPIGTGTILSAAKNGRAEAAWVDAATESMLRLNRHAMHLARAAKVTAATDVTGFGLLGHLWEMCERSGVAAEIVASDVPMLPGAEECSAMGVHTGGEARNAAWAGGHVRFADGVREERRALLFDPQTSGGLLLGCHPRRIDGLRAAFARDGQPLWTIGKVRQGTPEIRVS